MRWLGLILAAMLPAQQPVLSADAHDRALVALVDGIVASTSREWSEVAWAEGRSYSAPRIIYLRSPIGHPARGSGFNRRVGVIVDLGDVEAIQDVFRDDGRTLVGLVVAHEVGHHVQHTSGETRPPSEPAREAQADCYAGWWLARANARAVAMTRPPPFVIPDLEVRVPQMLQLLAALHAGRLLGGADPARHGTASDRVAAMRRGLAARLPSECS